MILFADIGQSPWTLTGLTNESRYPADHALMLFLMLKLNFPNRPLMT